MKGDATKSGSTYVLTKARSYQTGAVWMKNRLKTKSGLKVQFQYRVKNAKGTPASPGNALVLMLSRYPVMGFHYENLQEDAKAIGIELDAGPNDGGPSAAHVAIVKGAATNHLAYKRTNLAKSNRWRTVTVTYKKHVLTVKIGLKKVVQKKGVTLPSSIFAGITASAGFNGTTARYEVRKFKTNAKLEPVTTEGKLKATGSLKSAKFKTLAKVRRDYPITMKWATRKGLYVPGVDAAVANGSVCKNMVPQGICATWEYLLITAYCKEKGSDGKPKHDSVLYVMDKQTGELLTTLTLKGTRDLSRSGNHVGGICYDGANVFIATSGYLPDGKNIGELCLTYEEIENAVRHGKTSINTAGRYTALPGAGKNTAASFNCYYGGYLWIGYFTDDDDANGKKQKGTLTGYHMGSNRELTIGPTFKIADNANGATFLTGNSGELYLLVNQSFGRYKSTKAYTHVYKVNDITRSTDLTKSRVARFEMPRMLEEITYDGFTDEVYTLTESAAKQYRGNGYYPTNVIFAGNRNALLPQQAHTR